MRGSTLDALAQEAVIPAGPVPAGSRNPGAEGGGEATASKGHCESPNA